MEQIRLKEIVFHRPQITLYSHTRFVEHVVYLILISFYLLICNLEFDFLHVVLYLRKLYNPCECVNLV